MARTSVQPRVKTPLKPTPQAPPIRARSTSAPGVDLTAESTQGEPLLPHELDQTAGSVTRAPSARVKQAAKDVERGVRDTSRAEEADATYRRLKR